MKHTLTALLTDRPGVLNRALSLFRRHGLNIESLTVTRSERDGISRTTWVVDTPDVTHVIAQLSKLVDVIDVYEVQSHGSPSTPPPTSPFAITQADGVA